MKSDHSVVESPVFSLQKEGQSWLAGLLTSDDVSVGYPEDVHMVKFNGEAAFYERFLGRGSTGIVFEEAGTQSVIKLGKAQDISVEMANITRVHEKIALLGKKAKNQFAYVIEHLVPPLNAVKLSDDGTALRFPWLGSPPVFDGHGFSHLVDFLIF